MLRWITESLRQYTNRERSLLVMDSFRAHITDGVKKSLRKANVETAIIPGGCTSVLQPLDVSINKPFKCWLRTEWTKYIQEESLRVEKEQTAGNLAKIRPPSKQMVVDWVGSAVEKLKTRREMVQRSFVTTGIAVPLNGSKDHMIRNRDTDGDDNDDDDDENDFLGFGDEANTIASDLSGSDVDVSDVSCCSDE